MLNLLSTADEETEPNPSYLELFVRALKDPHSYNPLTNGFFWFGFLWGIPVPIVTLWFHYHLKSLRLTDLVREEPVQLFFLLHPVLFGFLFGLMGSMVQHYIDRLRRESIRDGLTGLYNHRYFRRELQRRINEAERYGLSLCLAMFDIDHFKQVNDQFGHQAGDVVLQQLADLLTRTTREADIVCRYGGEEFVVLLPETERKEALKLSERIRKGVEEQTFKKVGKITVSGGVAEFPDDETSDTGLIKTADKRLYDAKESGRNAIHPELAQ